MKILVNNLTAQTVVCKTDSVSVNILPYSREYMEIDKQMLISNENNSYIQKKMTGPVKHIYVDTLINIEELTEEKQFDIYNKTLVNFEDYKYYVLCVAEQMKNTTYKVKDAEKILSKLLGRKRKHFILELIFTPLIFVSADILVLNKLWKLFLSDIFKVDLFSLGLYLVVFTVNGVFQFIEYYGKNGRKEKQEIKSFLSDEYIKGFIKQCK